MNPPCTWTRELIMLDAGRTCWRVERADRASVIVDAADYFHHARKAMLAAKKQILMIGWDFDTRIQLDDADDEAPPTLGAFISWMAKHRPGVAIHILRWDWGRPSCWPGAPRRFACSTGRARRKSTSSSTELTLPAPAITRRSS